MHKVHEIIRRFGVECVTENESVAKTTICLLDEISEKLSYLIDRLSPVETKENVSTPIVVQQIEEETKPKTKRAKKEV